MDKLKILFDTDIGTDIDDALALTFLLNEPRCELLGITTCTGEAEERAKLASMLCLHANRPDTNIPWTGWLSGSGSDRMLCTTERSVKQMATSEGIP